MWTKDISIFTHSCSFLLIQKKRALKFGISNPFFFQRRNHIAVPFFFCCLFACLFLTIQYCLFSPHPAMVLAPGKLTAFALGLEISLNY